MDGVGGLKKKKKDCLVLSLKGVAEMLSDRCGGQDHNEQFPCFS